MFVESAQRRSHHQWLATMVVVGGAQCPVTSRPLVGDMARKRGWPQGSHRVLGGDPEPCTKRKMRSTCSRPRTRCRTPRTPHHRDRLHDPGAAMDTPLLRSGPQPTHCVHGVGGPHKTITLISVLLAASAATASVKEENWAFVHREVVDGKNTILNAQLFEHTPVGDRGLRKECAQRVLSALCTEAFPNQRRPVVIDLTTKSA